MITTDDNTVHVSGNSEATFSEERKNIKSGALSKLGVGLVMVAGVLTVQGNPTGASLSAPMSISSVPNAYNAGVRLYTNSNSGTMEESNMKPTGSNSQSNNRKSVKGNVIKRAVATRNITSLTPVDLPYEHIILDSPFNNDSRVIRSSSVTQKSFRRS